MDNGVVGEKKEVVRTGKTYKFLVEIKVFDTFMSLGDMVEFIKYRLNLRHAAELGTVMLVDREDYNA